MQGLIDKNKVGIFYVSRRWKRVNKKVLDLDNHECQICKRMGKATVSGLLVHHINHLRDRPDLALSIFSDAEQTARNLLTVCKDCHENICHPERLRKQETQEIITEERWD